MANESGAATIIDATGERGRVVDHRLEIDGVRYLTVERENGSSVLVPANALLPGGDDGDLRMDGRFDAHRARQPGEHESVSTTVPVVEEELTLEKREVETGRVRIRTRVDQHSQAIDVPVERQRVEIERVPVNRPADGSVEPRYEGDTLVIPLLEERIVVQKQLVVTEEVRVRRVVDEDRHREEIPLRIERVEIDRID